MLETIMSKSETATPSPTGTLLYSRVASLIFGQPLLVTPDVAETIGIYVRARMEGGAAPEPEANRFIGRPAADSHSGAWKGYRRSGPVGIVSIMGELVNRGAWLGASSGLTSYEGIVEQVRQAVADPDVRELVLDINSPGGEAYGMTDTARAIRSIARGAGKRVTAVVNSVGCSAAYGIATPADEIVVTESGVAGSIGVVMVHYDVSDRASKMGVKATVITAGKNKATGHPFAPLDDESHKKLKAKVDRIMNGFVKLVANHRPGLTAAKIHALEADTFLGEDAVKAGLADRTGTFEDVVAALTSGRASSAARRTGARTEIAAPAPAADAGELVPRADHDRLVAEAREEGLAAGREEAAAARAEGAAEARDRIVAILDNPAAQGREGLARHAAFKSTMSVDDAIAFLLVAPSETRTPSLHERMRNAPNTYLGPPPAPGSFDAPVNQYERGRQIAMKALGKI